MKYIMFAGFIAACVNGLFLVYFAHEGPHGLMYVGAVGWFIIAAINLVGFFSFIVGKNG